MKTKYLLILLLILITTTLSGCGRENDSSYSGYSKLTAKEAKEMMDDDSSITILDVRTEEEYKTGHIEGAILIPDTEILEKAEESLTDKSATILVYCRSGRRSALAAADLVELGYLKVYDFGGIIDWEYDIVTE
ncbi:rhodanese-like domain-containing protein [Anaerocolumna sp. MB42-C2]|uniref:rhodanese-like domain-containing protein n=1 Tax=Anaerocolumna sp. MB42-C2 TaxID=3070997 RepID=UPI0027E201DB|nr:rhodanese-like domain-containing protein [Anaerocolumna sp. MB42-C2]WMJ87959.1 rhodanese-like domain-containing protein [Anaerocolumna sp. MB42-C2]